MKAIRTLGLFALGAAGLWAQTPTVTFVGNAGSYTPPGLPNSGLAQGGMFVAFGSNLGPSPLVIATGYPLPTNMSGTSVNITVAGKTSAGILYYTSATQVAVILPSSTPTGTGTLTITYNNLTSAPFPITVVQNALGIFTTPANGAGAPIAFLGAGLVTPTNSANPGETLVFWGTGLGPVNFDETQAAQQSDMTNVPVEAYVGGKSAAILFRGRNACCSSVDTVYVQLPTGVTGCAVPVVFKIGNVVSNATNISIAASGRICVPTNPAFSSVDLSKVFSKSTFSLGAVTLERTVTASLPISVGGITIPGNTTKSDSGAATFFKVSIPQGAIGVATAVDIASYGSCSVSTFAGQSAPPLPFTITSLDAGASIGVSGPGGPKSLAKQTLGGLISYFAAFDSTATYLAPGAYSVTGPGGPDVGNFSSQFTLPAALTWTNQADTISVNRAGGVTVAWTGGDPAGYVVIAGSSFVGSSAANIVGASFACSARTSDGSFTVPPVVLLALPASGSITQGGVSVPVPGSLSVGSYSAAALFQASGLDYGSVSASAINSNQVTYQ